MQHSMGWVWHNLPENHSWHDRFTSSSLPTGGPQRPFRSSHTTCAKRNSLPDHNTAAPLQPTCNEQHHDNLLVQNGNNIAFCPFISSLTKTTRLCFLSPRIITFSPSLWPQPWEPPPLPSGHLGFLPARLPDPSPSLSSPQCNLQPRILLCLLPPCCPAWLLPCKAFCMFNIWTQKSSFPTTSLVHSLYSLPIPSYLKVPTWTINFHTLQTLYLLSVLRMMFFPLLI